MQGLISSCSSGLIYLKQNTKLRLGCKDRVPIPRFTVFKIVSDQGFVSSEGDSKSGFDQ